MLGRLPLVWHVSWEKPNYETEVYCYNIQNMPDSHRASAQAAAAESAEAAAAPNSHPAWGANCKKRSKTAISLASKNHCDANGIKILASTKFFSILRKVFVSEHCQKCIK
jgi:invasion protein IalB